MTVESLDSARKTESVTILTVAARAGLSRSTVSRYLQGSPHLTDTARQAIARAIQELDYRPNSMARNLSSKRTGSIGVLVNDLRQPWSVDFLEGLGDYLHQNDLFMLIGDGRLDRKADERLINSFMDTRIDGLVLAGTMDPSESIIEAASRLPTVISGSELFKSARTDLVAQDDETVVTLAMNHLIELGHRQITHVGGEAGLVFRLRLDAYLKQTRDAGLASDVILCDTTDEGGYQAALRILRRPAEHRPTAIFAASDFIALGVISAAAELGVSIPADLSIVGVDDIHLSQLRNIQLTSVDTAPAEQAHLCGVALMRRIANPNAPTTRQFVQPSLKIRGSTSSPRNFSC